MVGFGNFHVLHKRIHTPHAAAIALIPLYRTVRPQGCAEVKLAIIGLRRALARHFDGRVKRGYSALSSLPAVCTLQPPPADSRSEHKVELRQVIGHATYSGRHDLPFLIS